MEIKKSLPILFSTLISCATPALNPGSIADLYIDDFHSDTIHSCKTSDVELSRFQAREFFNKAKKVDYRIIHDHY